MVAALFGFELLQIHLPGRTAEITDAGLALLMAMVLWLSGEGARLAAGPHGPL